VFSSASWVRVPIGADAAGWTTYSVLRRVLVVVHTVTAMNRFEDVLDVFDSDHRVQLVFTFPNASAVPGDVEQLLHRQGAITIPWSQAIESDFDLAISAHNSGDLQKLKAPLVVLSHGMGYTKHSPTGNRKPETGNRKPETGNRKPETGNRKPETGNRKPETGTCTGFPLSRLSATAWWSRPRSCFPMRSNTPDSAR
jgi:hypothetical protein